MNKKKFNILNAEPYNFSKEANEKLVSIGNVLNKECNRNELIKNIKGKDILIVRLRNNIDLEILDKADRLKYIISATTGLNHISLEECEKRHIKVISLLGETAFLSEITSTAELAWSLIMSLSRRIDLYRNQVKNNIWDRDSFQTFSLSFFKLGIIGFGRLGSIVAKYGNFFGMRVLTYDPFVKKFPDYVDNVDLNNLLKESDIVSLHIPLNKSTKNFIDEDQLATIKKGAIIINTSRGEIINEDQVLKALKNNSIAGYGTDVLCGENSKIDWLKSNVLWKYSLNNKNVLITPHIGGSTFDAMRKAEIFVVNKLIKNELSN